MSRLLHQPDEPKRLNRWRWQLFALLLVLFWLALTAISTYWNLNDRNAELHQIKRQEMLALAIYLHSLADSLDHVFSDLRWLPMQNELQDWLAKPSPASLERVAREYRTLLTSKPIYDHIRIIGPRGREIVRVDYQDGTARVVAPEGLSDASHSYFVQETRQLASGEVYLSQLDLKVDRDRIITPFKPLLRFIAPVFGHDGERHGIIVLSYNASEMMADLRAAAAIYPGELSVLNASGYWLMAPRPEDEWGYLVPQRSSANLGVSHPELWRLIETSNSGQFESDAGIFTFTSVVPKAYWTRTPGASIEPGMLKSESLNGSDRWILLTHIPPETLDRLLAHYGVRIASFMVANLILAGVLAALFSQAWLKRRMHRIELEEMAYFDRLTGLPNRINLSHQLESHISSALRHGHSLALCLIDLDGFKSVNDSLGHDGGDLALIETARRFRGSIRQSDTAARIGGDEFMVLLPHIHTTDDAVGVAVKILKQLQQPILVRGQSCQLGASIGISLCPQDSSDAETLWHLADMAMYRAKNTGKHRFCFFSCIEDGDLVCRSQGKVVETGT